MNPSVKILSKINKDMGQHDHFKSRTYVFVELHLLTRI